MATKPKVPSASKQKRVDNLRNHLIGFHGIEYRLTYRKTYAQLLKMHDEVKEVRWCSTSATVKTSSS